MDASERDGNRKSIFQKRLSNHFFYVRFPELCAIFFAFSLGLLFQLHEFLRRCWKRLWAKTAMWTIGSFRHMELTHRTFWKGYNFSNCLWNDGSHGYYWNYSIYTNVSHPSKKEVATPENRISRLRKSSILISFDHSTEISSLAPTPQVWNILVQNSHFQSMYL